MRTKKSKRGILVRNGFGRITGSITRGVLVRYANAERHMLRFPHGWAFDKSILDQAAAAGVKEILVIDEYSKKNYTTSLATMLEEGIFVDRGFGEQRCLPLKFWKVSTT